MSWAAPPISLADRSFQIIRLDSYHARAYAGNRTGEEGVAMIFRQFLRPETGCAAYLLG